MPATEGKLTNQVRLCVRLLPPGLTEHNFTTQVTKHIPQWLQVKDFYYVEGSYPDKPYDRPTYSRAYFVVRRSDEAQTIQEELSGKPFTDEINGAFVPIIGKAVLDSKLIKYSESRIKSTKGKKKKAMPLQDITEFQRYKEFLDGQGDNFLLIPPKKRKKKTKKKKSAIGEEKKEDNGAENDKEAAKKPKKKKKKLKDTAKPAEAEPTKIAKESKRAKKKKAITNESSELKPSNPKATEPKANPETPNQESPKKEGQAKKPRKRKPKPQRNTEKPKTTSNDQSATKT